MNIVEIHHVQRPDGRVCSMHILMDSGGDDRIAWSCDGKETNNDAPWELLADEEPLSCFVCIAEGK